MSTLRQSNADSRYVYKKTIGNYTVHAGERVISCALSSRLRKEFTYTSPTHRPSGRLSKRLKRSSMLDPIAIGDVVRFIEAPDGTGMIVEVLPRQNRLARKTAVPMPGAHAFEQVIVANVDQVVPVFAAASPATALEYARPLPGRRRITWPARASSASRSLTWPGRDGEIDEEIREAVGDYRKIGYPVIWSAHLQAQGMDELKEALRGSDLGVCREVRRRKIFPAQCDPAWPGAAGKTRSAR